MNTTTLALAAFAVVASTPAWAFDGPYAGVQLGHNSTNIKYTETVGTDFWKLDGLNASGADYGVYGGYGKVME